MMRSAMDSLDFVQFVMVLEEVLEIEISDDEAEHAGGPREMVDILERHLSNQRPTKKAADLLRRLAKSKNNPELAEGLDGVWRREQIAAIIREFFRD
jgi:hypothetical protein